MLRMLSLVERSSLISFCGRGFASTSNRLFSDRISDAYRAVQKPAQAVVKEGGGYATRVSHEMQMKSQRTRGGDEGTGIIPTKWQKRFLVITRLYKRQRDIPQYVLAGTMNRMNERMRVVFIAVGVTFFFAIFYYFESENARKIARDRDAGIRLKSMHNSQFGNVHRDGDDDGSSFTNHIDQFNTTFGDFSLISHKALKSTSVMLSLLERSPSAVLCRCALAPTSKRLLSDRISDAYKAVRKPPQRAAKEGGASYATRISFDEQMKLQRTLGADADTGVIPTKWQKRWLVITRLYNRPSDIPQYVSGATMNRLSDRLRIVFISVGVVCFYVFFYYIESTNAKKIARDRDAGVVLKESRSP
ncbi:hypothetical protein GCK32_012831 [Trichostrongylus colubriformis]|uniref:Uncharacterized protein n=1 Tax=Trichostrongylus colubriformis TaxID=6319 RepID=A0AAN8FDL7_TRICO